jgi:Uma2 family endonuclease
MLKQIQHRLWTVDEYHALAEAGILHEDERVELIEGELVTMSPIGIRHAATVNRINELLVRHFQGRAIVSVQNPVGVDDHSEPQPDVALLRYRDDYYAGCLPAAADVLLCIEVSDATIAYDRDVKGPLYARAGIADYWLVNLVDNVVEVYRQPQKGTYSRRQRHAQAGELAPLSFPETSFKPVDLIAM